MLQRRHQSNYARAFHVNNQHDQKYHDDLLRHMQNVLSYQCQILM